MILGITVNNLVSLTTARATIWPIIQICSVATLAQQSALPANALPPAARVPKNNYLTNSQILLQVSWITKVLLQVQAEILLTSLSLPSQNSVFRLW